MSRARIVIIEEDAKSAERMAGRLREEGYETRTASDGQGGLSLARTFAPDLFILSATLEDPPSSRVVKRIRKSPRTAGVPVLLTSVYHKESDEIVALEAGADDFMLRPVAPAVLAARVAALLRRFGVRGDEAGGAFQIGPIRIDTIRHEVAVDGTPQPLTLTEFRLLSTLAEAGGRVLTRNQLIDQAIGMDAIVTDRTIDVHLTALRRKLGGARKHLKTIRGVGYRLAVDETDAE